MGKHPRLGRDREIVIALDCTGHGRGCTSSPCSVWSIACAYPMQQRSPGPALGCPGSSPSGMARSTSAWRRTRSRTTWTTSEQQSADFAGRTTPTTHQSYWEARLSCRPYGRRSPKTPASKERGGIHSSEWEQQLSGQWGAAYMASRFGRGGTAWPCHASTAGIQPRGSGATRPA